MKTKKLFLSVLMLFSALFFSGCISTGKTTFKKMGPDCEITNTQYNFDLMHKTINQGECPTPVPVAVGQRVQPCPPGATSMMPQPQVMYQPASYMSTSAQEPITSNIALAQRYTTGDGRYYVKYSDGYKYHWVEVPPPQQVQQQVQYYQPPQFNTQVTIAPRIRF